MVRLTGEDLGVLAVVCQPNEARAHTYLRLAREAVLPRDILLRYKLPADHKACKLFPDWMQTGPMGAIEALWRGEKLLQRGYVVETQQVQSPAPPPRWDDGGEE